MNRRKVFYAAGKRSPFTRVDGPLAEFDVVSLSGHVLRALAAEARAPLDGVLWGSVAQHVSVSNLAREALHEAGLAPSTPAYSVIMACSTSMVGAFDAAGHVASGHGELYVAGGTELMSRVQVGLSQDTSDLLRRVTQARTGKARWEVLKTARASALGLDIPRVQNRVTGKSMGEHMEETAQHWKIARADQDDWALLSHQRAVTAQQRGFFAPLIVTTGKASADAFPRADTSRERLAKLSPSFAQAPLGTLTAGNSSPLTDGAAGLFVASEAGLARLPSSTPAVELVDYELCAVDVARHGLLMAPAFGLPRLLARNGLRYEDVALYEIHEAFAAQVLTHFAAFEDAAFLEQFGVARAALGAFPRERVNPNGGSVALGHPFAATGARILSQAVSELAALPSASYGVVSICADGGLGTVALLRAR